MDITSFLVHPNEAVHLWTCNSTCLMNPFTLRMDMYSDGFVSVHFMDLYLVHLQTYIRPHYNPIYFTDRWVLAWICIRPCYGLISHPLTDLYLSTLWTIIFYSSFRTSPSSYRLVTLIQHMVEPVHFMDFIRFWSSSWMNPSSYGLYHKSVHLWTW